MKTTYPLAGRQTRALGLLAGVVLLAGGMPGCSGETGSISSPDVSDMAATEEQRELGREVTTSLRVLDRFVEAYNARSPRVLQLLHHGKYRFFTSPADDALPETMTRLEMLRSTRTMLLAENVLDVNLTMEVTNVEPHLERRQPMVVHATMMLEVTMENVFGPPIVYLVDHHPARFVMVPRGGDWAIVEHVDMYEEDGGERVVVQKTWGQVLDEFLQM